MKKAGIAWRGLLGAVAAGVALLVAPLAAPAHAAAGSANATGENTGAASRAVGGHDAGCMDHGAIPAGSHRLNCRLSSLPAMDVGARHAGGHDPDSAPVLAVRALVAREFGLPPAPAASVPIAAIPGFILFGNFRS